MRHLRNIGNDDLAGDVLADAKCDLRPRIPELLRAEDVTEVDGSAMLVRYFDAYR